MVGRNLHTDRPMLLPFGLFSLNSSCPESDYGLFAASSTGLAAGNTADEAVLHGLYEVVERDAVHGWIRGGCRHKEAQVLNIEPDVHPELASIMNAFEQASLECCLVRVSARVPLMVTICLLWEKHSHGGLGRLHLGSGCDRDLVVAATKAALEAAQTRLTQIVGAREDLEAKNFRGVATDIGPFFVRGGRSCQRIPPPRQIVTVDEELRQVLVYFDGGSFGDIFIFDHSRLLSEFQVSHVYVPGFCVFGDDYD